MAAAEARAAWQRVANRCFVQEDAKRAPKLACCPSSSAKLQPDSSSGTTANGTGQPASNCVPLNWSTGVSNLPPDTKWRLQLQPNFGCLNDATCEQLCASEELEDESGETGIPTPNVSEDPTLIAAASVATERKSGSLEAPWMVSASFMKHGSEARVGGLKTANDNFQQQNKPITDLGESWYQHENLMDWKAFDHLVLKKPEKEAPWAGSEKTEPWWRIADKDELASFVAQKSLENFENCDLPPPQRVHFYGGDPFGCVEGFDENRFFALSLDHKLHTGTCFPADYENNCSASWNKNGGHQASGVSHSVYDSAERFSGMCRYNMHGPSNDPLERKQRAECDSDKAELLEALHHSQKRAREAEMAAQQAYIEKEHIVKLFFKQASHLFAYKQWVRMLQLESLLLQLKIKEHKISSLLPVLPWMPPKVTQLGSGRRTANKRRGQNQKCDFCMCAVAFAVGLGLVSAGLLFGWTLGWLLPVF